MRINLYINGKEVQNNIKSIASEYRNAVRDLSKMTIGSKEYYAQAKEVRKLKDILNDHNKSLGHVQGAWQSFKTNFGGWIAAGFGLATAGQIFRSFFTNIKEFEKGASELSALTGLMGDDLQYLKNQALNMGSDLKGSGVQISQSATEILEAFKIVGSAKPELLKNKEALAEVTKQAIVLSEASGMELKPAVESLTLSMNQFGASASETKRFINVLAAGAKEGAAEIHDLTESIREFGTVSNMANLSIEQSVALVEALAEKGLKGSRAGIGIRNVLLELMSGADETNPKVVGLNTALENLAAKNLTAAEMTKMFGKENVVAAGILIETRGRIEELNGAITNTNTAYEQAAINTDNLQGSLDNLKSGWSSLLISLSQGGGWLSKVFKAVIDMVNEAVEEWRRWAMSDEEEAYEKKLDAQVEFIKKFKQHSKLGQEDIEAEWNERLAGQLKSFEMFGKYYDSEQLAQFNKELENIHEHINLIKQAKAEIETENVKIPPLDLDGTSTTGGNGEDTIETDPSELTDRDYGYITKLETLSAMEIEIHDKKLSDIEMRESEHVKTIAEKQKWLTEERQNQINTYGEAAMKLGNALVNFNNAAMNRELAAAGNNEAAKDEIRRKYAKKNQEISAAQARIQGALAIMSIWAGTISGNPLIDTILKALLTAAVIIETESQVSLIKSQSFAEGGFTHGEKQYVAGEAGQEWIAPNWMTEHPYINPVIRDLEAVRMGVAPETIFRPPVIPSDLSSNSISATDSGKSSTENNLVPEMINKMQEMIDQNKELIGYMKDPKNRRAVIAYDDLKRSDDEIALLQELGKI
jgi:TP901 family phage tail tape measure protein